MRALRLAALLGLAMPVATPAAAQEAELFAPPPGCSTHLTVQLRGCLVSNHFTCATDASGVHRTALADATGVITINTLDAEFQWIENAFPQLGITEALVQPSPDPASFSELLAAGRDEYEFEMLSSDGTIERFVGYDALSGSSVAIDGESLQSTEFAYRRTYLPTGEVTEVSGQQYVSARFRLFFSGAERTRRADGTVTTSNLAPRTFSEPGEPGFAAAKPIFDCDTLLSDASLAAIRPAAVRR